MKQLIKNSLLIKVIVISAMVVLISGSAYLIVSAGNKDNNGKPSFTDFTKEISADRIYNTIKEFSAVDNARITGFKGESSTAKSISKQFKELGFDVTEQSFPIKAYSCKNTKVTILSDKNKVVESRFLSYSKATPKEGISAELVSAGMGSQSELLAVNVKGKLVLIKRGGEFFRTKVDRAYIKGAVGVIFYDPGQEGPITATLVESSTLPAATISKSDAEAIEAKLKSGAKVKINLMIDSICKDGTSKNIIATMKASGSKSGKTLVVGAHYDGVDTPAANDNASGIAVVLETAKLMAKQKLDCDVKFIAFGAEEIGLVGSKYYVDSLSNDEMQKILCMINLDMVGVGDTLAVHTMYNSDQSPFVKLAKNAMDWFKYKNRSYDQENSDHVSFESAGIPTAYLEYGPYTNYHTDTDNIQHIDKGDLLKVCNITANLCKEIGGNPDNYPRK